MRNVLNGLLVVTRRRQTVTIELLPAIAQRDNFRFRSTQIDTNSHSSLLFKTMQGQRQFVIIAR